MTIKVAQKNDGTSFMNSTIRLQIDLCHPLYSLVYRAYDRSFNRWAKSSFPFPKRIVIEPKFTAILNIADIETKFLLVSCMEFYDRERGCQIFETEWVQTFND